MLFVLLQIALPRSLLYRTDIFSSRCKLIVFISFTAERKYFTPASL
jgi:hypothetical protein